MKKVHFKSEGLTLVGNLYEPKNFDENQCYPTVIIDGSWTTVKEQMQSLYAKALAEKGFVAFTFDHRNFGESEGQPREYESHEVKVQDLKDVISFLLKLPFVDTENITGLGICASGAYILEAAAEDNRLKKVVTVASWLMTPETAKLFYGGDEGIKLHIEKAKAAKEKFINEGINQSVPAYDPNNMEAAMFFPVDYYAKPDRGAVPTWRNNFAEMSWEKWLTYDGIAASKKVEVPVLMIASEKQFLPDGTKEAFHNLSNKHKSLAWLNEFEHTDFYDNSKAIESSTELIAQFLGNVN
jgi:uncharacterized protein